MNRKLSSQILPTAANLIGFCLFIITSLHVTNKASTSLVDEFTSIVTFLLTIACLFSFMELRSLKEKNQMVFERIAEISFIFSLFGILLVIFLLVIGYIN
ncbi:MAG: hypothetical protein ACKOX3_10170 [Bacteroidota bacterium]